MNDRELLEMAGKAYKPVCADGSYSFYWNSNWDCMVYVTGDLDEYGGTCQIQWNPLTDDGDCARMEADLGLDVVWYEIEVSSSNEDGSRYIQYADHAGDKQAARRMASVSAAAEIGKAMP